MKLILLTLLLLINLSIFVNGHGFTLFPISRVHRCNTNPQNNIWWPNDGSGIQDADCRAAYDHVYQRNGQSQPAAVVQFTQANEFAVMIPKYDSGFVALKEAVPYNLCSAGANDSTLNFGDKSGFSIATDWQLTKIKTDNHVATIDFNFCATAVHNPSYWEIYLSYDDYDLTSQELTWDNLELVAEVGNVLPSTNHDHTCPSSSAYFFTVTIPARSKPATILTRWQRDDPAGECFIQCSDVVFE